MTGGCDGHGDVNGPGYEFKSLRLVVTMMSGIWFGDDGDIDDIDDCDDDDDDDDDGGGDDVDDNVDDDDDD